MSLPAIDDFTRANNAFLGANYTYEQGSSPNFGVFSNGVYCFESGSVEGLVRWSADAAPDDQKVSLRYKAGSGFIGPTARVSAGFGYGLWLIAGGAGASVVSKWLGGPSRTDLGSVDGFSADDLGQIEVVGTGLTARKNGVTIGTFTDASIASGGFGMHGYVESGTLADDFLGEAIGEVIPEYTEEFVSDAAGTGWVEKSDASWDTAHDALAGTVGSPANPAISYAANNAGLYGIGRVFVPVDTSDLLDDDDIVAASLFVHSDTVLNGDADANAFIVVVGPTSQASPTALVGADFDQCGAVDSPQELSARKTIGSIGLASWIEFVLNADGRDAIERNGYTQLGLREGHDVVDDPVTVNTFSFASWFTPLEAGKEPYLSITYQRARRTKFILTRPAP